MSSFADDTRLLKIIKNNGDGILMQHDLEVIYEWVNLNTIVFNGTNCELFKYVARPEI